MDQLLARMPHKYGRYYEPFAGGAALFFRLAPRRAVLADSNPDLIGLYTAVANDVSAVIRRLQAHRDAHDEAHYYEMRARWNDRELRVSERSLEHAFMVFSSVDDWLGTTREPAFRSLLSGTRRSRGFGDFWGHMLVARGAADFMIEPQLRLWDWASVVIIVEEAGGVVTTFEGDPPSDGSSILTANREVHGDVLRALEAAR